MKPFGFLVLLITLVVLAGPISGAGPGVEGLHRVPYRVNESSAEWDRYGGRTIQDAWIPRKTTWIEEGCHVRAGAFSPDGGLVAVGGIQGVLLVLDTTTGKARWSVSIGEEIHQIAWAPVGGRIAVGTRGGAFAVVWNGSIAWVQHPIDDARRIRTVNQVLFSPSGDLVAVRSFRRLQIHDAATGASRLDLRTGGFFGSLAWFHPDRIATPDHVYRLSDGTEIQDYRFHWDNGSRKAVEGLRYSEDGRQLFSTSADQTVRIHESATGSLIHRHGIEGLRGKRIGVLPGRLVVSGTSIRGNTIYLAVLDRESGGLHATLGCPVHVANPVRDRTHLAAMACTGEDTVRVLVGSDHEGLSRIHRWNLPPAATLGTPPRRLGASIRWTPREVSGRACPRPSPRAGGGGRGGGAIRVETREVEIPARRDRQVRSMDPEDQITPAVRERVRVTIRNNDHENGMRERGRSRKTRFLTDPTNFSYAAFTPEGSTLVTASVSGVVEIWDTVAGTKTGGWKVDTRIMGLAMGPDGGSVLLAGDYGGLAEWSLADRKVIRELPDTGGGGRSYAARLSLSSDGTQLAVSQGSQYRVISLTDGSLLAFSASSMGGPVAFTPSGRYLVTDAGLFDIADGSIRVPYDLTSTGPGSARGVRALAIDPDSQFVISFNGSGALRFHAPRTGQLLHEVNVKHRIQGPMEITGIRFLGPERFMTLRNDGMTVWDLSRRTTLVELSNVYQETHHSRVKTTVESWPRAWLRAVVRVGPGAFLGASSPVQGHGARIQRWEIDESILTP